MKNILKKIPYGMYSFASIVAVAAINYTLIHNGIIFIFLLVLLAHELGHFFAAKKHNGNPKFPLFIPFPFFLIAMTKVSKMNPEGIQATAFYGPFAGFVTASLILLSNSIFKFVSSTPLIILAISEIIFNFFGSDGSKYRNAKRKEMSCQYL